MIRVSEVHLDSESERLVVEVLRSGHLVQGPMVERFEQGFCDVSGTSHAVAVCNGTVALDLALEASGIGPGDEVVTTPFTFAATLNAILHRGASARLVDISPDDFNIDVAAVDAVIGQRTRAIMPVHLYGQAAELPALLDLARRHEVQLVEDAAQAHGATVDGRRAGSFGVGCFSLYATKNLTTGEGGVVTTDDGALADRCRVLRNQGMSDRYVYETPGQNYRMTDLQAAIGLAELQHLASRTGQRRTNAAWLSEGLAGIPGLTTPVTRPGRGHVFHQYTIRISPEARLDRDTLAKELEGLGIGTGTYYPRPLHHYDCYRDHPRVVVEPAPHAEQAAREVLSLPVHPWLTPQDLDRIVTTVGELLG